jgi:hypothetical protein
VLESVGLPGLLVDVLIGVDEITWDNVYPVPSPTVFDLTRHAPRSVKDWVDEHVSLFAAPAARPIGEGHTIVIAKGSITHPDALAPYLDDEMRVLRELKASIDAVRERVDTTLPFVIENVATLEYDKIYEI